MADAVKKGAGLLTCLADFFGGKHGFHIVVCCQAVIQFPTDGWNSAPVPES